jgi:hypothetical protein
MLQLNAAQLLLAWGEGGAFGISVVVLIPSYITLKL